MTEPRTEGVQYLIAHQTAVEDARRVGDTPTQARALLALGILRDLRGEQPEAFAHFDDALALADDAALKCSVQIHTGYLYLRRGAALPAKACFEAALQSAQASGDAAAESSAFAALACVAHGSEGKEGQARLYMERTLPADKFCLPLQLLLSKQDRTALIAELHRETSAARLVGDVLRETELYIRLAELYLIADKDADAEQMAERIAALAQRTGARFNEAYALFIRGSVQLHNALRFRDAEATLRTAQRIAQDRGFKYLDLSIQVMLHSYLIMTNSNVHSKELYQQALQQGQDLLAYAEALGQHHTQGAVSHTLSLLAARLGNQRDAVTYAKNAAAIYAGLGDLPHVQRIGRRLRWLGLLGRWQQFTARFKRAQIAKG